MGSRRQTQTVRDALASGVPVKLPRTLRGLVKARTSLADPLKDFVRRIPGGSRAVYALLQHCTDDEDAKRIVDAWDETLTAHGTKVGNIPVSEVVEKADLSPREFVGIVTRCAWDFNLDAAKGIFASRYPQMMEASMRRAMENDATNERELHFKATGHVPTSKGIQIAVQQNNRDREPEPGEAPAVGRTARRIVRDLPPAP